MPSPVSAAPSPPPSSALSAFLRGIERRAFVFAQVQCGDDAAAEAALARTLTTFSRKAAGTPLSSWPADFWVLLLAQPELVGGSSQVPELAPLGQGPRAALLLRLVSGLDFAHAAQVLGVGEATYRFALQRALQQLGAAGISYAALSGLRERLHRQVKTLPGVRTGALEALRQQALTAPPEPDPAPADPAAAAALAPPRRPWWLWLLWALLAALAVAFAATFVPRTPTLEAGSSRPLPDESPQDAPVRMQGDAEVLSHPDYAQLAAPDAEPVAADLAFLSWLANTDAASTAAAADGAGDPAPPAPSFDAGVPPPSAAAIAAAPAEFGALPDGTRALLAPLASGWAQLDAATRARLIANVAHWNALDASGREALAARMRAWDALPAPERAARRAPFDAWQRLPPSEQARVRALAARTAALPEPDRATLRARFDALDAEQRRDWWLGPVLGADFAGLHPLVAFVPDTEMAPVLAMLRTLSPPARRDLAELVRRLPVAERETLRGELLAAAPDAREALIATRLGR